MLHLLAYNFHVVLELRSVVLHHYMPQSVTARAQHKSAVVPCVEEVKNVQVAAVHEAFKLLQANIPILIKHISLPQSSFNSVRNLHMMSSASKKANIVHAFTGLTR